MALQTAQAEGERLEQQRLDELESQGLSLAEAEAQLLDEQKREARRINQEIAELTTQGKTAEEINALTGGVPAGDISGSKIEPLTTVDDVYLGRPYLRYYSSNNSYAANGFWDHNPDLESGEDLAGIRVNKSIVHLDGMARICNEGPSPDVCVNKNAQHADPQGDALEFNSESGDYGTFVLSFKKDGNKCYQIFNHYAHAWSGVAITGVGISTSGINVNFSSSSHHWGPTSRSGDTTGC